MYLKQNPNDIDITVLICRSEATKYKTGVFSKETRLVCFVFLRGWSGHMLIHSFSASGHVFFSDSRNLIFHFLLAQFAIFVFVHLFDDRSILGLIR